MAEVTVLAAAYNEEDIIESFVSAVTAQLPDEWELLVVDDGSEDATPRLMEGLAAADHRIRIVTHQENRGLGAALATGFREAGGRAIVTLDADLTHPLAMVPELVAGLEQADAVFASRYVPGGGMPGVPWWRKLISQVGNRVLRVLYGTGVHDLTTGFRAFRSEAVKGLRLRGSRFETQLEITIRLVTAGRRIDEVPLLLRQREAGESKMRYLRLLPRYAGMALYLLGLRWLGWE